MVISKIKLIEKNSPLIITCEHALPFFPLFKVPSLKYLWRWRYDLYDRGALRTAKYLACYLKGSLIYPCFSPLYVNVNQGVRSPYLTKPGLTKEEKKRRLEEIYFPFHRALNSLVRRQLQKRALVYLISLHTFFPECDRGGNRKIEVGLLYRGKKNYFFCRKLKKQLEKRGLLVAYNEPYSLKKETVGYTLKLYDLKERIKGVELEINNYFFRRKIKRKKNIGELLGESFKEVIK